MLDLLIVGKHHLVDGIRARHATQAIVAPVLALDPRATVSPSGTESSCSIVVNAKIDDEKLPAIHRAMEAAAKKYDYEYLYLKLL